MSEKILAAVKAGAEVYKYSCVGGNAHIVLDDGNLGDSCLKFCLEQSRSSTDPDYTKEQLAAEQECLSTMLGLTELERRAVVKIVCILDTLRCLTEEKNGIEGE